VREYDISYQGDEVVVNVFKSPAFFPMSWAVAKTPNRYFFDAGSKVSVHQAPPEEAAGFIKANPDVMMDLLTRLYIGVDGMQRRMAHLMGGSAKSRLLFELIIECKRFGKPQTAGAYLININETEIGARAGLSRETVSRAMKELKKLNLIFVNKQGIVLKNLEALELKLGPDL
jgi:CRP-like cAMP-binding protein